MNCFLDLILFNEREFKLGAGRKGKQEKIRIFPYSVAFMLICDGSSKADIYSARGFMQARALKGRPTVFVTTWSIEACSILLGYFGEETYFTASGVFLEYRHSGHKHSKYINDLTGVENGMVDTGEGGSDGYQGGSGDSWSGSDGNQGRGTGDGSSSYSGYSDSGKGSSRSFSGGSEDRGISMMDLLGR
jgi:hypothetical protein